MSAASPALVASLLQVSPQLRSLPRHVRQRIAEAGDVNGPGLVRVTATSLNVRASGSTSAKVLGTEPSGAIGMTDGTVDNGFAFVHWNDGKIGWSAVQYLAPEAEALTSASANAPQSPDLPAGVYVAKVSDGLNLRATPEVKEGNIVGSVPPGAKVVSSGLNKNYFTQVTYEGQIGWAASHFLVPESQTVYSQSGSDLVLSSSDILQIRAMLAAWANATPNAPPYGNAADLTLDANGMQRQGNEVAAFQQWENAMGKGLRTDGIVDSATRDALIEWSQAAVKGAVVGGGAAPEGLPTIPPVNPVLDTPASQGGGGVSAAEGGGVVLGLIALGAAAFFVVEQKRKRAAA